MYTSYVVLFLLLIAAISRFPRVNCLDAGQNCGSCNGGNGYTRSTYNASAPANIQGEPDNSWEIELTDKTALSIRKSRDELTLKISKSSGPVEARKKKMNVMDVIPYLIIPGFLSAGILPWLIPGMKIAVMGVAMMNQMAFTSSLFSLIRGYIFDTSQEDHVVYVNHGYEKYKHQKHPHMHR